MTEPKYIQKIIGKIQYWVLNPKWSDLSREQRASISSLYHMSNKKEKE